MNLIIAGPQGSGKGTQADLLAEKLELVHLEMGEILRQQAEKKSVLGKKIAGLINKGTMAPDKLTIRTLRSFLIKNNLKKGIIFDGFPRRLSQVYLLEKELEKRSSKIDKFIYLSIPREETLRRLGARRVCPRCDRNYNLITVPPKNDELCDDCQVKLITRDDETPEAINKRLELFEKNTLPVVDYYRQKGLVVDIDGRPPVDEIHKNILKALNL